MNQPAYVKEIVLYADDDPDDLELLETAFLPYTQLQLKTFANGTGLVSYIRQLTASDQAPCLIILDINMPLLNGWETLKELRKLDITRETHILFFSTSVLQKHAPTGAESADIIAKPASLAEVGRVMDKIIAHCPTELQKKFGKVSSE
jgi:CheY-like chemotaxis protein